MTQYVTFLLSLLCWAIITNDLNNQIIDGLGALTTLFGADEHRRALVTTQLHRG